MPSRSFFRRPAVLLVLALCAVAVIVSLLGKLAGGGRSAQKAIALVSSGGAESYPSFSPDGNRLAYSARRGKEPFHLYVRRLPSGAPQELTGADDSDTGAAWSPDGATIAFLRGEGSDAQCMTVPASGGAERRIAACGAPAQGEGLPPAVAWMPDGKALIAPVATGEVVKAPGRARSGPGAAASAPERRAEARRQPGRAASQGDGEKTQAESGPTYALSAIPLDGSAAKRLTEPPAGSRGDYNPAVSPDGSRLAFIRDLGQGNLDIFVLDLAGGGKPRQLTFEGQGIRGLAWTPDGRDLVFSGNRGPGGWRLWRVPAAGGSPRDLIMAGRQAQYPAVARSGRRLVYTETPSIAAIWRAPLGGEGPGEGAPLIRSAGRETSPSYSPGGDRIASVSDQSGAEELWVCDAGGGNRRQLTHFAGNGHPTRPRWSPDGSKILFELRGLGETGIYTVQTSGGEPARLAGGGSGSWSHDGASIYYSYRSQIWKVAASGGEPKRLADGGGVQPTESADGKYVYYRQWRTIWRVPVNGGEEEEFITPEHDLTGSTFAPVAKGVYYVEWNRGKRQQQIAYYDLATRKSSVAFAAEDADLGSFSISPDSNFVIYSRVDRSETNLMLVEDFR